MKAYTQGEIDYFCAIYSIINSARFAARNIRRLSFMESCKFYQHMMQYLYDHGKLLDVLYHGTEYDLID